MPLSGPAAAARNASLTAAGGDRLAELHREVDHRHVGGRDPDRDAVELALELGQHEADRGGGPGGGRDHAHRARAGAAQVLVREVVDRLVVGVGVHGRGEAALDAEVVEQDLGHRGQAVGGAGGVRDQLVLGRIVLALVDAEHDRDVRVLGGRGDHDLLGAGLQVLGGHGPVPEDAGGLHHDVDAHLAPRQRGRILGRADADLPAVDEDRLALGLHLGVQRAVDGIVLQQVGQRLGVGQIIDRHHLEVRGLERRAKENPADASEPVHPDTHCHGRSLSCLSRFVEYFRSTEDSDYSEPGR